MTIPPVPANPTAGVVPLAWGDDVYDLLNFLRDDKPLFKGQCANFPTLNGVWTDVRFSDGAGAFSFTPSLNIGTFTPVTGAGNGYGVKVPEDGVYEGIVRLEFAADATVSRRGARAFVDGTTISSSEILIGAAASASGVSHCQSIFVTSEIIAGTEIHVQGFNDSGDDLGMSDSWLTLRWVGTND